MEFIRYNWQLEEMNKLKLNSGSTALEEPPIGMSVVTSLVALFACALSYYSIYGSLGRYAPAHLMYWWAAGHWIFLSAWLSLEIARQILSKGGKRRARFWVYAARVIVVGIYLGLNIDAWLLVPYIPVEYQLTVVASVKGTVAILLLSLPEWRSFNRFLNMSTLLSFAAMLYFRNVTFWQYVVPSLLAYAAAMFILARVLENSVRDIRDAKAQAETQRDARTRFMASASHDLGQPLHSARLFVDLVVRASDPVAREDAGKHARIALNAIDRQLKMMLDHLRLDTGKVSASITDVDVGARIIGAASQFEPTARLAGVSLIAMPSRLKVKADPELFERALGNLVDNAIRHADAKRILIGTRGNRIWVIDDGRGITATDRLTLFEDFVQGSEDGGKTRGGFGLGLGSVRRLMKLMGGRAGIEVKWTRGSAFYLEFPDAA